MSHSKSHQVVSWSEMNAAIQENPSKDEALSTEMVDRIASDNAVPWLPSGWSENRDQTVTDAISLSLWIKEPLYRSATPAIRMALEREESENLLTSIDTAMTEHNGKSRGWIRKHLEEAFSSPKPYTNNEFWKAVKEDKKVALLLDFVCVVRNLRVALWFPASEATEATVASTVSVLPHTSNQRAQMIQLNAESSYLLLNSVGTPYVPCKEWPTFFLTAKNTTWIPATSAPSIGSQTIAQIREKLRTVSSEPLGAKESRTSLWNRYLWLTMVQTFTESD